MTAPRDEDEIRPEEPVVVRDRRKVDPDTGELRQESVEQEMPAGGVTSAEAAAGAPAGAPAEDERSAADQLGETAAAGEPVTGDGAEAAVSPAEKELAERTADLQRVQAEYANYRKRVERDREAERVTAQAAVVGELLPVLDDLGRAEAHGDLTGAFKSVADKLTDVLANAGLTAFGAEGDAFDPSVHEAVQHETSPEVDGPTVTTVLRQGYALGDRVLRHALVAVTDHEPGPTPAVEQVADTPATPENPVDPPAEGELPIDGDGNTR